MDNCQPTSVYKYYDSWGVLLYVGITSRGAARNVEHDGKIWWQYVSRQEVEHCESREDALNVEAKLIKEYCPPFNIQHNKFSADSRDAYLALRQKSSSGKSVNLVPTGKARWFDGRVVRREKDVLILEFSGNLILESLQPSPNARSPKRCRVLWVKPVPRGAQVALRCRKFIDGRPRLLVKYADKGVFVKVVDFNA